MPHSYADCLCDGLIYREILNGILTMDKITKELKKATKGIAELFKGIITHLQTLVESDMGLDDISVEDVHTMAE